ncbi:MAG: ParB/RepB/Spo0J family partition protein [Rhodospirillales bacterium]
MNDKKRSNLGRGLSALLGGDNDAPYAAPAPASRPGPGRDAVATTALHPGRYQPRRGMDADALTALAQSIAEKGILQPILVRPHPDKPDDYEIIAGERRWRAAQQAKLHEVPVIVRDLSDADALEIGLIENLQREDLTPIEEAEGLRRLMEEFGHTQEVLAKHIGKSRSHIANTLRLLTLPASVQKLLGDGTLSAGHARALVGHDAAEQLARQIAAQGLSVRQAEALAHKPGGGTSAKRSPPAKDADTAALERDLKATLGLAVDIRNKGGSGTLTVHYKTLDQLDDVLRRLSHQRKS